MNGNVKDSNGVYFVESAAFCQVGEEWNNNDWSFKNNPTGYHALYFRTDSGEGRAYLHTAEGRIEILPDRVYFIPAYSVLKSEISGSICKYFVHFNARFSDMGYECCMLKKCSVPAEPYTKLLFDIIVSCHKSDSPMSRDKAAGAMRIIMADLSSELFDDMKNAKRFDKVIKYVESNYPSKISVSELARMMNLSTVYFSNLFCATFKISPKRFILNKRLHESKKLLAQTDLSVSEIAAAVGFENPNWFSELFSEKTGSSPLEFRKKHFN